VFAFLSIISRVKYLQYLNFSIIVIKKALVCSRMRYNIFLLPPFRCFENVTSPDINYPLYTRRYRGSMTYQAQFDGWKGKYIFQNWNVKASSIMQINKWLWCHIYNVTRRQWRPAISDSSDSRIRNVFLSHTGRVCPIGLNISPRLLASLCTRQVHFCLLK
jgi:hypothetical protein